MKSRIVSLLGLLALLGALTGCESQDSMTRHIIGDSQLNWLEINYVPAIGQPATRISLVGSGHISLKRGTSPMVADDFSQDVADKAWTDMDADQASMSPAEMRGVFQALVDRGLLGKPNKDFLAAASRGGPTARICGQLDENRVVRFVVEPELLDVVRKLANYFDNTPEPTRKGAQTTPAQSH